MQINSIVSAEGIYPADDYVHAIEVTKANRLVYVSGTMGLDAYGKPADSLQEQLHLIWHNIETILQSAEMTLDNIIRVTSYLRKPEFAKANQMARLAALKGRKVATTAIVVETLEKNWLVEIEVIAAGE